MKPHETIFEKLKTMLKEYFGEELMEYDEGNHITINDTGIWLSSDEHEFTVGYGMNHRHYHCEFDDIKEALSEFQNLLTRKKRITNYFKGEYQYKSMAEIETENGEFKQLSTSLTWLFPYWKKTRSEMRYIDPLIDSPNICEKIEKLKEYV